MKENDKLIKKYRKFALIMRCVWISSCLIFLTFGIVFSILYSNSKVVTETDYGYWGVHTFVTYNFEYKKYAMFGFFASFMSMIATWLSYVSLKTKTVKIDDNEILLYIGFIKNKLYINGEFQDEIATRFNKGYLEGKLDDGTIVNATRSWEGVFHLTFSNGAKAIDL